MYPLLFSPIITHQKRKELRCKHLLNLTKKGNLPLQCKKMASVCGRNNSFIVGGGEGVFSKRSGRFFPPLLVYRLSLLSKSSFKSSQTLCHRGVKLLNKIIKNQIITLSWFKKLRFSKCRCDEIWINLPEKHCMYIYLISISFSLAILAA